jgi:hypothetical protein
MPARLLPRGPHGRPCGRWCGAELPSKSRTFCASVKAQVRLHRWEGGRWVDDVQVVAEGRGCVHEHLVRSSPPYARTCCWIRDRGRCALCAVRRRLRRPERSLGCRPRRAGRRGRRLVRGRRRWALTKLGRALIDDEARR